jgi:hypothetical protein
MWPSVTLVVRPVKVTSYVKTFVDVSNVAVNVPDPLELVAGFSPPGVRAALNVTIFETGAGWVESLPHAASATVAAASTRVIAPFFIGRSWTKGKSADF